MHDFVCSDLDGYEGSTVVLTSVGFGSAWIAIEMPLEYCSYANIQYANTSEY